MSTKLPSDALQDIRILVVDDEDILAWSIENELKACGAEVARAGSLSQAIERFHQFSPDVAITDLRLPDGNGLELLKKWRLKAPNVPVILITAHGAIDSAVTALRLGAFDYLQKPFDLKDLAAAVHRASEVAQLRQKVGRFEGAIKPQDSLNIIGDDPAMIELRRNLHRIAESKADTVLIQGETGSGKELAARAVHEWSSRAKEAYMEINCASIPETLLESELFGFEKGAFTDARQRKLGLFEMARNGTIFLDEIGELPLKLQAKLLRALEYRRFKRLGGVKDIEFNARIVAATNRNLLQESAAGRFRLDLYYRLNALPIKVPPLRDRRADIPRLAEFFLEKLADELGVAKPALSASAVEVLQEHTWPGNVRELRNALQRVIIFDQPSIILAKHLHLEKLERAPLDAYETAPAPHLNTNIADIKSASRPIDSGGIVLPDAGISLEDVEKSLIVQALAKALQNQSRAAQLLNITRHTLRYRMEKYGLDVGTTEEAAAHK